ncbi:2-amino-4-hydroxy-6-hydroxymethyldihydropteridine diphosphokinase [Tahibacter soli]|uniref:2-amino-4-hydroxy-6-hydroxymethyldihydropteridine pyrophosphokinase n=1 Tax=Tahibacter soli TaxID=2983605 RepID=A0A9X3YGI2_9GAMM|nr:2-amino-4-hydroxy-6-hydroxymethyldihydropteridine diphosphokinase [Tahibacter soli]MDC8011781.1 2-amino-4-hydroxy-6-hydroxymethyldihydropteridine diphosphokinase [Tahibacter soli]
MTIAHVGIGSNLGDSRRVVAGAVEALAALASTRVVRSSAHYATPPWGRVDQPPFINAVVEIDTALSAQELLAALLDIERAAGRVRDGSRWGPRVLDLDLLLYGDAIVSEPGLSVPHPHLAQRAFVLLPLAELAPDREVPGAGRVRDLVARVDSAGCRRLA